MTVRQRLNGDCETTMTEVNGDRGWMVTVRQRLNGDCESTMTEATVTEKLNGD